MHRRADGGLNVGGELVAAQGGALGRAVGDDAEVLASWWDTDEGQAAWPFPPEARTGILANMRLCANVPSQHAIQTALGGYQSINDLVLPPGRLLEQRNRTWELLNDIPGISCVKPMGALYAFPRIDPKICPIHNDEKFVLDLLLSEKLLIVQGTAFNWPWPDHFRVVTLPRVDDLEQAIGRIGNFLKTYHQ